MKCPQCNVELTPATRHNIQVHACPSCKGMWFERLELEELEDEAFDFGEHAKGTLVPSSTPTSLECPECSGPLSRFQYRFYDLEMEYCEQHGYWLTDDEDNRVLALMKQEEKDLSRKLIAESRWAATLKRMRAGSLLDRIRRALY